jgi:Fe-S-cluster containining protein
MSDETELSPGAKLCLACGLCCTGVLGPHAPLLEPDDLAIAKRNRLRVIPEEGVFELPCPRLDGTKCEVYLDRPHICGSFRCTLLARLQDEGGPIEPFIDAVTRTKELLAYLESKGMSLHAGQDRKIEASGDDAYEMMSVVAELMQRLQTDFVNTSPYREPIKYPKDGSDA